MSVCVDERIDTVLMISWFSRRSIGAQSPGPSAWRRPTRSSQRPDFFLDLIHRHNILQRISDGAAPRRLSTLMPINLSNSARDKGIGSFYSGRAIPSRDTRNDSVCTANEKKKRKRERKRKMIAGTGEMMFRHEEDVRQRCALHFDRITTSTVAQDTPDICHSHHRDRW